MSLLQLKREFQNTTITMANDGDEKAYWNSTDNELTVTIDGDSALISRLDAGKTIVHVGGDSATVESISDAVDGIAKTFVLSSAITSPPTTGDTTMVFVVEDAPGTAIDERWAKSGVLPLSRNYTGILKPSETEDESGEDHRWIVYGDAPEDILSDDDSGELKGFSSLPPDESIYGIVARAYVDDAETDRAYVLWGGSSADRDPKYRLTFATDQYCFVQIRTDGAIFAEAGSTTLPGNSHIEIWTLVAKGSPGEVGGDSLEIEDDQIMAEHIANEQIQARHFASDAADGLEDGSIAHRHLANSAVQNENVLSVDATKIVGGLLDEKVIPALDASKITGTIADERLPAVSRIADEIVTEPKLDASNDPGDGQVLSWDDDHGLTWKDDETASAGSGLASVSTDGTLEGTGETTDPLHIADDGVTASKIASSAVTDEKIQSVDAAKITGTINSSRIPDSIARDSELPGDNRLIPSGGGSGQVLKKASGGDYAVDWQDDDAGGTGGASSFADLTGEIATDQIPGSAVTDAKIASVSASKITGEIPDARIPDSIARDSEIKDFALTGGRGILDGDVEGIGAGKIESGTLDDDRLSGNIARTADIPTNTLSSVSTATPVSGDGTGGSPVTISDDAIAEAKLDDAARAKLNTAIPLSDFPSGADAESVIEGYYNNDDILKINGKFYLPVRVVNREASRMEVQWEAFISQASADADGNRFRGAYYYNNPSSASRESGDYWYDLGYDTWYSQGQTTFVPLPNGPQPPAFLYSWLEDYPTEEEASSHATAADQLSYFNGQVQRVSSYRAPQTSDIDYVLRPYDEPLHTNATLAVDDGGNLGVPDEGIGTNQIADESVTEGKLDVSNDPADNQVLSFDSTSGLTWRTETTATGGLTEVSSDSTLDGRGTSGEPLGVANPFLAADKDKLDGIDSGAQINIGTEYTQTEKTKLQSIEQDAKDNQTGSEIVAAIDTELGGDAWKTDTGLTSVSSDDTLDGDGTPGSGLSVANPFTDADKTKLDGIDLGAQANVQSDWSESDNASDAFVLNKPTLPADNRLVPSGGTNGQVLKKTSDNDYAAGWQDDLSGTGGASDFNGLTGTIDDGQIPDDRIIRRMVADDAIGTDQIEDGTVTQAKLGNLDAGVIAGGTFGIGRIPDIPATKITGILDDARIPDSIARDSEIPDVTSFLSAVASDSTIGGDGTSVSPLTIADGAVTDAKVTDINASKVTGGVFDQARIPNLDASKIASGQFATGRIADDAVTGDKIASDTITADNMGSDSVGQSELASASVGTTELVDANVTTDKLADMAVTALKLADGAVVPSKVSGTTDGSSNASDGHVLTADGTGAAAWEAPAAGGLSSVATDGTIDGTGTSGSPLGIADNSIRPDMVRTHAITEPKLAPGSVRRDKMDSESAADGQILTADGSGGVEWEDAPGLTTVETSGSVSGDGTSGSPVTIADGAIGSVQIANDSITPDELRTHSVTESKIAPDSVDHNKITSGSAADGHVLTSDGSGDASWEAATGGLSTVETSAPISGDGTNSSPVTIADSEILQRHVALANSGTTDFGAGIVKSLDPTGNAFGRGRIQTGEIEDAAVIPSKVSGTTDGTVNAVDGQVLTADGSGNAAWETSPLATESSPGLTRFATQQEASDAAPGDFALKPSHLSPIFSIFVSDDDINVTSPSNEDPGIAASRQSIAEALSNVSVSDGGIDTAQLADESVTEPKLDVSNAPADNQLLSYDTAGGGQMTWIDPPSATVADGSITTAKIANDAVTEDKLAQAVVDQLGGSGPSTVSNASLAGNDIETLFDNRADTETAITVNAGTGSALLSADMALSRALAVADDEQDLRVRFIYTQDGEIRSVDTTVNAGVFRNFTANNAATGSVLPTGGYHIFSSVDGRSNRSLTSLFGRAAILVRGSVAAGDVVRIYLNTTSNSAVAITELRGVVELVPHIDALTISGGGATALTALTDFPDTFGAAGQILNVNADADALEFIDQISSLTDLTDDFPDALGTAGQILQVNTGGSALEFADAVPGGASNIVDLDDVADALGAAGQILQVDSGATALEFADPVSDITDLSDVPDALGSSGQILKVNAGRTAMEFATDLTSAGAAGAIYAGAGHYTVILWQQIAEGIAPTAPNAEALTEDGDLRTSWDGGWSTGRISIPNTGQTIWRATGFYTVSDDGDFTDISWQWQAVFQLQYSPNRVDTTDAIDTTATATRSRYERSRLPTGGWGPWFPLEDETDGWVDFFGDMAAFRTSSSSTSTRTYDLAEAVDLSAFHEIRIDARAYGSSSTDGNETPTRWGAQGSVFFFRDDNGWTEHASAPSGLSLGSYKVTLDDVDGMYAVQAGGSDLNSSQPSNLHASNDLPERRQSFFVHLTSGINAVTNTINGVVINNFPSNWAKTTANIYFR